MRSSFHPEDVQLLLKDITGLVEPMPTREREKRIQSGTHYSEMLPLEYKPSDKYVEIYEKALRVFARPTAEAVGKVSQVIWSIKREKVVLISLARAGTPIGILIKRYMEKMYRVSIPHYSISIICDRGIDKNALNYVISRHSPSDIIFVDGWVGKGAIFNELKNALSEFQGVSSELAVLADPAHITDLCGTHDDILIPSSCLNSTVSGLISRTFFRNDIIGLGDFHGAAYYSELLGEDRTYEFINAIQEQFQYSIYEKTVDNMSSYNGLAEVNEIAREYNISNINLIKPGIGETTRVLLRRVPWKVIIDNAYMEDIELAHIIQLANEKNVPVENRRLINYKCCGIIENITDT